MKIILDAGHGPETAGKRSPDGRLREFHFNAAVAEETKKRLVLDGHIVIFAHQADRDVPLSERIHLANRLGADLYISVHANAFGNGFNSANGIETYHFVKPLAASKRLAASIHQSLALATGLRDRGVKAADFAVLRNTRMPAVLVECGFMTNRTDLEALQSDAYRKRCARAIAFGVGHYELTK
ncbi:N-acetylmuramoyl-L-alanine amidase [Planomicrobium sp. YIM 101495]|uniref:N-acetylmuramoyl-L-alanine amidase n=1 Tax=Planomicrobium sp. YIM 101495 TaxID=2665160 RepID=UPI0012B9589F|nr:N-acetylmuramoyl-L-alanine amidase [Planomicrobium sp. YIM 101495]MTD31663.1 N-acetylmuramoyl-L-alanine amidase [Planomicrobium sp. YIM 101495]